MLDKLELETRARETLKKANAIEANAGAALIDQYLDGNITQVQLADRLADLGIGNRAVQIIMDGVSAYEEENND